MADVAALCIGERERGQNEGVFVETVWREAGFSRWFYQTRQPWCAAFVRFCAVRAGRIRPCLSTIPPVKIAASVRGWMEWCEGNALQLDKTRGERGDVVIFLPRLSHIGIIGERTAAGYLTIEGNTNAQGSREGNGVWQRQRKFAECGSVWALPVRVL